MKKVFSFLILGLLIILVACVGDKTNTYTITWEVEGKIIETDNNVEEGTMPEYNGSTPTKAEDDDYYYRFEKWSPDLYKVDKDQKYVAVFDKIAKEVEDETYTVTFNSNGGSEVKAQEVENGKTVAKPTNPTRDGYTFKGWYTDSALTKEYDFKTVVTGNLTLYAKWEKVEEAATKVTVTFNSNGGSAVASQTVDEGAKVTKPGDPTRDGYTFGGWYTDVALTTRYNFESAVTTNLTLFAKWNEVIEEDPKTYTVSFVLPEGCNPINSQIIEAGGLVVEPEAPKLEGYNFICWCIDEEKEVEFDFKTKVNSNLVLYAKFNPKVNVVEYLKSLVSMIKVNPYSYIPKTLQPGYEANLVNLEDVNYDFTNFVDVSSINYGGFGEQWNMVISNLNQSKVFFNVLTTLDTVTSASITAFQNYIDSNPSDTASYDFKYGTYDVTINLVDNTLFYVLGFTTNIPLLGKQNIEVMISYDILENVVDGRIQIGDANALAYSIAKNKFTFAYKFLGIGEAYFDISNTAGLVSGHIYEYLTVGDDATIKSSCADFYITHDRLITVGNKASGMIGFTGTIVEMYDVTTGKLIGYEVNEKLSIINYDTLWFNLSDIEGINSIKVIEGSSEDNDLNNDTIYVNNSSKQFVSKKGMLSRRYDIEMRSQYFYYLDEETNEYEVIEVKIPMLFVQEDCYDDLITDIKEENNVTISLNKNITDNVDFLIEYYDLYIPSFETNKELITHEIIEEYIGVKYSDLTNNN